MENKAFVYQSDREQRFDKDMFFQLVVDSLVSIIEAGLSWLQCGGLTGAHAPALSLGDIAMNRTILPPSSEPPAPANRQRSSAEGTAPVADHPVLSRLLAEVRNERHVEASYDRVHNRHNRGR